MRWCSSKGLFCILLLFLLLFLVRFLASQDTSQAQILIYESELSSLKSNLLKLALLSQTLEKQVQTLKSNSSGLLIQLEELKKKRETLESQIGSLESALMDWKSQYEISLQASTELTDRLGKLQTSYGILLESFNQYRTEVNKEILKLKAEKLTLGIVSGLSGILCIVLGGLYLVEKFTN